MKYDAFTLWPSTAVNWCLHISNNDAMMHMSKTLKESSFTFCAAVKHKTLQKYSLQYILLITIWYFYLRCHVSGGGPAPYVGNKRSF